MRVEADVDLRNFNNALRKLKHSSANPKEYIKVMKSEAASVIAIVAWMCKPAKKGDVRKQSFVKAIGRVEDGGHIQTINSGARGGRKGVVWYSSPDYKGEKNAKGWRVSGIATGGGISRKLKDFKGEWDAARFTQNDWTMVKRIFGEAIKRGKQDVNKALKSIGLEQKTWLDIIKLLGFDPLNHEPKSRKRSKDALNAITRGGKRLMVSSARVKIAGSGLFIETVNRSDLAYKAKPKRKGDGGKGGEQKVRGALRTRKNAINKRLKFEKLAKAKQSGFEVLK